MLKYAQRHKINAFYFSIIVANCLIWSVRRKNSKKKYKQNDAIMSEILKKSLMFSI